MSLTKAGLQKQKRELAFLVREERIRRNAIERQERENAALNRLDSEVRMLAKTAAELGINHHIR
jgi:hypothetical protein